MKHHGMIFRADEVRAILDGRKTQDRRLYKGCNPTFYPSSAGGCWGIPIGEREKWPIKVGDIIWVRETWAPNTGDVLTGKAYYKADGKVTVPRWTPSIHMPRWASRIDLEVTAVRVERLQDISEEDAKWEGVTIGEDRSHSFAEHGLKYQPHKDAFRRLWQSIYANWETNPWVWVYEFRRVK
jgi:hypothetical protein